MHFLYNKVFSIQRLHDLMEALLSLIFASLTIDFPTGDGGGGIPPTKQNVAHSLHLVKVPPGRFIPTKKLQ